MSFNNMARVILYGLIDKAREEEHQPDFVIPSSCDSACCNLSCSSSCFSKTSFYPIKDEALLLSTLASALENALKDVRKYSADSWWSCFWQPNPVTAEDAEKIITALYKRSKLNLTAYFTTADNRKCRTKLTGMGIQFNIHQTAGDEDDQLISVAFPRELFTSEMSLRETISLALQPNAEACRLLGTSTASGDSKANPPPKHTASVELILK